MKHLKAHPLTRRAYESDEDYWQIRAFLREVFLRNQRRNIAWDLMRFDYWRWHVYENIRPIPSLAEAIQLWHDAEGRIAAMLIAEGKHDIYFNIHPDHASTELQAEMLDVAEGLYGQAGEKLCVYAHELDRSLQKLLVERAYVRGNHPEHQFQRDLRQELPEVAIPLAYQVRAIHDIEEWPARSWCSWRAFHPDEPDENYEGWVWSLNWQRSPLYRRDLDIVAVAPGGEIAAYCIFWYDDVTRAGLFEPVAVMPEHQRKGLGRAIMLTAMQRARNMGATLAMVSGYSEGAIRLYSSILSPDDDLNVAWVKVM